MQNKIFSSPAELRNLQRARRSSKSSDPPINSLPDSQTIEQNITLAITGLSVDDPDNDIDSVQLQVENGVISVDLTNNVSITSGSNHSPTLTLTGSRDNINATLKTLSYTSDVDFLGVDTFSILTTDQSDTPLTDQDSFTIEVTPRDNYAPQADGEPEGWFAFVPQ